MNLLSAVRLPSRMMLIAAFVLAPFGVAAGAPAYPLGVNWAVDRLDDPALPDATECTAAANDCSLRGALSVAEPGDSIGFLVDGALQLSQGEIVITKSVSFQGPGVDVLAIHAAADLRIFTLAPGLDVQLSSLTLRDGHAAEYGGAIYNNGSHLMLTDCALVDNTAVDGGGAVYNFAFNISGGAVAVLEIAGCQFSNNRASGPNELDERVGGAIYNYAVRMGNTAMVTITQSSFSQNIADGTYLAGGAIKNYALGYSGDEVNPAFASVHISASTLISNTAPHGEGGALVNRAWDAAAVALLTIENSTLSGNTSGSTYFGGGVIANHSWNRNGQGDHLASVVVRNSTFDNNAATERTGGVLANFAFAENSHATADFTNTTFSRNSSAQAGSVIANIAIGPSDAGPAVGTVNLTHVTMVRNQASTGGAISNTPSGVAPQATVNLQNSLLYLNGADCQNAGTIAGANNLIDTETCGSGPGFRLGAATQVGILQNNGGPTLTHGLLAGSNALDAVPDGECTLVNTATLVSEDQRGEPRPLGDACDIGAVEGVVEGDAEPPDYYLFLPIIIK